MALLNEEKQKPSLWNQAIKAVKGDSTNELVEEFTQEMTLIAEGLCEDQARLRKAVDGLLRETEGQRNQAQQDYQALEQLMADHEKANHKRMDELSRRIEALEKPAKVKRGKSFLGADLLGRITLLASIVCGTWLLVTLLNLLK